MARITKKTSTMLRKLVVPPGQPFSDLEGKTVAASSPLGFFIPVEGDLVGSKLTLHILDARSDISDLVEAQVTYVLVGPMILAPIIVGIFGGFAVGYVTPMLYVPGDAATTTGNVVANAGLVRFSVLADLLQGHLRVRDQVFFLVVRFIVKIDDAQ